MMGFVYLVLEYSDILLLFKAIMLNLFIES